MAVSKPITCDGHVVGSITVALAEEGADGASFQSAALEDAPGELSTAPSWRHSGDHAPGDAVPHHDRGPTFRRNVGPGHRQHEHEAQQVAHDRQHSGPDKQPTFRPGLTPRGTAPAAKPTELTTKDIAAAVAGGGGVDRSQIARELSGNEALLRRYATMAYREVNAGASDRALTAQAETAANRALKRGHSLEQALWDTSGHGNSGYYPRITFDRGISDSEFEHFKKEIMPGVLAGSDVVRGMTGNASDAPGNPVRSHQIARGTPYTDEFRKEGGDTYFDEDVGKTLPRLPGKPQGVTRLGAGPRPKGESTFANLPSGIADLAYLTQHGGHSTTNGKRASVGHSMGFDPELAKRLHAAGEAYEKETGAKPQYGEADRDAATQQRYWEDSGHGSRYPAAPPGKSMHQSGKAMDLPDSEFRKWLKDGNMNRFGLHFPVRGDAPHVQADPNFEGHKEANK
jgi:hypothetical protein